MSGWDSRAAAAGEQVGGAQGLFLPPPHILSAGGGSGSLVEGEGRGVRGAVDLGTGEVGVGAGSLAGWGCAAHGHPYVGGPGVSRRGSRTDYPQRRLCVQIQFAVTQLWLQTLLTRIQLLSGKRRQPPQPLRLISSLG